MAAIPDNVSELFSKRSRVGEQWASFEARYEGVKWDDLTKQEQERRVNRYPRDKDQQLAKGEMLAYGGYDGVVAQVAQLYRERLEATGEAPTISAPTNFDAHTIGAAVRDQRRARGLLGGDIRTIRATDGQRDFTLRLAKGDRVRLFRSVGAKFTDGRGGSIGRNGSVLEGLSADQDGLALRNKHGRVGKVRWADLPKDRGRIQLAYGYAMTIHTAQGLTNREHMSALPTGSQAIDGMLGYSTKAGSHCTGRICTRYSPPTVMPTAPTSETDGAGFEFRTLRSSSHERSDHGVRSRKTLTSHVRSMIAMRSCQRHLSVWHTWPMGTKLY
jgi:hypothetical protein